MKYNAVKTHDVVLNGCRIDSCFHLSDGNSSRRFILNSPYKTIKVQEIAERIFYGNRAKRTYVPKRSHGLPFLSSSDILQADLDNVKYASRKLTHDIEGLKLEYGWTLITRSGTVGKTVYSTNVHAGKLASDHVIRLVPNGRMKGGCVYAYLSTKYGYALLTQGMFGAVIQSIEPQYIENLPVPNFPESYQTEIDDLIQESARLREEATEALEEAVSMFEKEIGQSNLSLGHQCGSVSSSAISDKFIRFDSQYQLGYQTLQKEKRALSTEKISTFAKNIYIGNRDKRNYVENGGIPFLSSSDMMLANPKRSCKQLSKRASNLSTLLVSKGTILISRSGTVGHTIIVGDTIDGCAVSEHAMRLVIDEDRIAPEYVFAYFKTKQGQNSLKILPYGSVIVTLGEDFLGNVDLPILTKEKQDMITELVKMFITKSDKAVTNENLAISKVEQEIERWNHQ